MIACPFNPSREDPNEMIKRLFLLALLLGLAACAAPERALKSKGLGDGGQALPKKLLFIPPDVRVSEISAGGVVEEVPEWTRKANGYMHDGFAALSRDLRMTTVEPPKLAKDQQDLLDQHIALYDVVAGNAFSMGRNPDAAWEHKRRDFDYTLGPGLAFMAEQSGADAAVFIVGADFNSTSGRKAAMVVGALLGIAIPGGISYLTAGVVDLKTGNLLWLNYELDQSSDMREAKDADQMLHKVFSSYPGLNGAAAGGK